LGRKTKGIRKRLRQRSDLQGEKKNAGLWSPKGGGKIWEGKREKAGAGNKFHPGSQEPEGHVKRGKKKRKDRQNLIFERTLPELWQPGIEKGERKGEKHLYF